MPPKSGYTAWQKARYISMIQSDQIMNELRLKQKRAADEARINSEEYKADVARRAPKQAKYKETQKNLEIERENLEAILPVFVEDLISEIKKDLETLSPVETLKKHKEEIIELETKSDRLLELIKQKFPTKNTTYFSMFFYELSELNPEFTLYAPVKTFTRTYGKNRANLYDLKKLTDKQLKELYNKIFKEDSSVLVDETFLTFYAKYFRNSINHLKNLDDVKFNLTKYPENFSLLNDVYKNQLKGQNEMVYVVNKAPTIIMFMTREEIEEFAKINLRLFATATMKAPEVLDYLDEGFFNRHDYRLCYTNQTKEQMRKAFGDRVNRHPRLKAYINVKQEQRNLNQDLYY